MDIFVGLVLGAALAIGSFFVIDRIKHSPYQIKLRMSQSHIYDMYPPTLNIPERIETQASKYNDSSQTRILFTEQHAYWIKDNSVYRADVVDGAILNESAKPLDIMSMDKVELDEMMFIIETLTEGSDNDYRNPRD